MFDEWVGDAAAGTPGAARRTPVGRQGRGARLDEVVDPGWAGFPDGAQVAGWVSGPGSAGLASLLDGLLEPPWRHDRDGAVADRGGAGVQDMAGADLSDVDLVEVVAAFGRVAAWAQALQSRLAGELALRFAGTSPVGAGSFRSVGRIDPERADVLDPVPGVGGVRDEAVAGAASELSMRLGVSRSAAGAMVRSGLRMSGVLSATGDALARGEIDWSKARVIVDVLGPAPLPVAWAVEDRVLPTASERTTAQLRRDLAAALIEVDPLDAAERAERAVADRRVEHPRVLPDGMALVRAYLPAEAAMRLDATLHGAATAARTAGDPRTVDQLRADVLDAMARQAWDSGRIGCAAGAPADDPGVWRIARGRAHRTQVHVTVGLTTLLGLDENAGFLRGYGPIDADSARRLAQDGTWRRLLVDPPSGLVTDLGHTRYDPPPDLAELVAVRNRTCVVPTCAVPATVCQIDHMVPFPRRNGRPDVRRRTSGDSVREEVAGSAERAEPSGTAGLLPGPGRTDLPNLVPLCPFHHQAKTDGLLRVRRSATGEVELTTSTGHRYRSAPDRPAGVPDPDQRALPLDPLRWLDHFAVPAEPSTPAASPPSGQNRPSGQNPASGDDPAPTAGPPSRPNPSSGEQPTPTAGPPSPVDPRPGEDAPF